jgi:hypothetical protein
LVLVFALTLPVVLILPLVWALRLGSACGSVLLLDLEARFVREADRVSLHSSLNFGRLADPARSSEHSRLVEPAIGMQLRSVVFVFVVPPVSVTGLPVTQMIGPFAVRIGALMAVVVVVVVVVIT